MTRISVLPIPGGPGPAFRAVSDGVKGTGTAPGEAIDALIAQTGRPTGTTLILLHQPGPDEFFPAAKRDRLIELMARWRAARDSGSALDATEQTELEALVDEEQRAVIARSATLLRATRS